VRRRLGLDDHRALRGRCDSEERPWRTLEQVEFATLEWFAGFDNRRLLTSIGEVPPAEFEATYYAAKERSAKEVGLN